MQPILAALIPFLFIWIETNTVTLLSKYCILTLIAPWLCIYMHKQIDVFFLINLQLHVQGGCLHWLQHIIAYCFIMVKNFTVYAFISSCIFFLNEKNEQCFNFKMATNVWPKAKDAVFSMMGWVKNVYIVQYCFQNIYSVIISSLSISRFNIKSIFATQFYEFWFSAFFPIFLWRLCCYNKVRTLSLFETNFYTF